METLKVSTRSNPNSVAGAMAGAVRQAGAVEVQVVGAGALNQAIKAVAIARNYVASAGLDLVCSPTFADISIDGEDRTGIHLLVETVDSRSHDGADAHAGAQADGTRFRVTAASLMAGAPMDGAGSNGGGDASASAARVAGSAPASEGQPPILQG